MNAAEEHAVRRRLLRQLGSTYPYLEDTLPAGDWGHVPVRIVVTGKPVPPRTAPARRDDPPREPREAGPSALAFALAGPGVFEGAPPLAEPLTQSLSDPVVTTNPAKTLRDLLEARGHLVLVKSGGRLFISNASALTDEDREAIKEHREALIKIGTPWVEPKETSLAVFLGSAPAPEVPKDWVPREPPSLDGINEIILNFETNGLDWAGSSEPIGVTVGTIDGKLSRYLPFAHAGGGNLDKGAVIRYLQQEVRGKHILNANTRFEVHMGRKIDVDFEAQGNTVSDIMHWAALLDDHRRRFKLDVLLQDYFPDDPVVERLDESQLTNYSAAAATPRAEYQAIAVAKLREVMLPQIKAQDLEEVLELENDVIYPLCEMERNGSKIDVELTKEMYRICKETHDKLMMEVSNEAGFAFEHTAAGWKRLLERFGIPDAGSYNEKTLTGLKHWLIEKAYRASQYASLNSKTFGPYLEKVNADGILRFDINQLRGEDGGTVSGRFSIGYVQQVPNHDNHHLAFGNGPLDDCKHSDCYLFPRRVFIGDGYDYLEADAMQIEFRLLAHFAQNKALLQAYKDDPLMSYHKTTWKMIKQYKPDTVYSHLKNFNFARQYGGKTIKLATMMEFITEQEGNEIRANKRWDDPRLKQVQEIESAFRQMMPEGDVVFDRAAHLAKPYCDDYCKKGDALHRQFPHRGFVKTIAGRRSRFPDGYKTYIGLNRVLQGSGADIMKKKIAALHKERKYTNFLMRLTVHDAIGGDAREGAETQRRVAEILNVQSYPELRVPILWSSGVGRSWAHCKS